MIPGQRVVFGRQFLRSVGLVCRLELHDRAGMLIAVDDDGFAEVLFDGDSDATTVLTENLVPETATRRVSWRPPAVSLYRWAV